MPTPARLPSPAAQGTIAGAMAIRVLPKIVADKIAAGEVIERPASVVKELLENAVDAGAHRIEVEVEQGGAQLVRVADDGCGIGPDDLALAFLSHSTSKLEDESDLFAVRTMGFRGEALSSIAAVSQARIVSRTAGLDEGYEVSAEGGEIGAPKACPAPPGTQIEVRNLFFNVPVRRKFLKRPATEMAHVVEAVTRVALAQPEVHFVLTHNGRSVFNLPPAQDLAARLGEFFGREMADNLIPFSARHPHLEVEGFLLPPSVSRGNSTMQYTYVNRRYVRDRSLLHAVAEAYRGLMMTQRRPVCFMMLSVDPGDVDVNVHPTKIEIRFRHPREVHSSLLASMRDCLRQAHLTPQVTLTPEDAPPAGERSESIRQAMSDFFAGRQDSGGASAAPPRAPSTARGPAPAPMPGRPTEAPPQPPLHAHYGACMQVLDSYIVEETPDGVRLIDQHALHERILYEKLRAQIDSGPPASQRLLVPELVELPKAEFLALMELAEDLRRFGMEIEEFGESTIIVRSYPQMLGRFDGRRFFHDLLDEMEGPEGVRRVDGRLDKLLTMMACKGAVKAGQRLSAEQIRRILEQRAEAGPADTCPHGRPTSILLTRRELDKQFHRT